MWTRCIFIGKTNRPDAPVGIAIKADREIVDRVAGKRSFDTTTMTVVLSGNVMHDDRWLSPGDFYVSPPGEVAGSFVFGSEGAIIFIMFDNRSEEHTSELQSLMRISYAVFCLKKKKNTQQSSHPHLSLLQNPPVV